MAGHTKSAQGLGCLGKQLLNKIWSNPLPPFYYSLGRRAAHTSVYDKNPDDQLVRPSAVPDEIIQPHADKYWAPHPQTGIFGPAASGQVSAADEEAAAAAVKATQDSQDSVLEEKAWFRPTSLEDLDKPHHP